MDLRNSQASLTLDLIRGVSAQAVCVGHTIGLFGIAAWAQPPNVPYMQNVAVLMFFLLSGFLIAYTLATRSTNPQYGFEHYLTERFARIYSTFFVSLVVIAIIDGLLWLATGDKGTNYTRHHFFGSLFMLNVGGPLSKHEVHSFGTAGQLWTLSIEWHLYMIAGALFFIRRSWWMPIFAILFSTVPIAYFGEQRGLDYGHGLTLLWALGFASYYLLPYIARLSKGSLAVIALLSLVAYFWLLEPGWEFQIATYPLLTATFACSVAIAGRFKASEGLGPKIIRLVAAYSFTLYVVHNTLVKATFRLWDGDPYIGAALAFVGANILAVAIAMPTEMRHRDFARFLLRRLSGSANAAARSQSV